MKTKQKFLNAEIVASLTESGKYRLIHITSACGENGKYSRGFEPNDKYPRGKNPTIAYTTKYIDLLKDPDTELSHLTLAECETFGEERIVKTSAPSKTGLYSNEDPKILVMQDNTTYKVFMGSPRNRDKADMSDRPWLKVIPIEQEDIDNALNRLKVMTSLVVF